MAFCQQYSSAIAAAGDKILSRPVNMPMTQDASRLSMASLRARRAVSGRLLSLTELMFSVTFQSGSKRYFERLAGV